MRNGPQIAAWDVVCPSAAAVGAVRDLLSREANLDHEHLVPVTDGGATREESHRLGEFFRATASSVLAGYHLASALSGPYHHHFHYPYHCTHESLKPGWNPRPQQLTSAQQPSTHDPSREHPGCDGSARASASTDRLTARYLSAESRRALRSVPFSR